MRTSGGTGRKKMVGNGKVNIFLTLNESLSEVLNVVTSGKTSQTVKAGGTK